MALGDSRPVMDAGAAEWIDPESQVRAANHIQVDHIAKIVDVSAEIIVRVRRRGAQSPLVGDSFHSFEVGFKQRIRLRLNPTGHGVVRRPSVRRVIFEAAVVRRIMRGRDDNPVGQSRFSPAIVSQNRVGNHRGRRVFVPFGQHHLDAVRREHFERGGTGRNRQRVRIDAEKQRTRDVLLGAILANRLGNREDVPFVESPLERRAAMPRGAERHALRWHSGIGHLRVVSGDEPRHIDQYSGWRWLTC